jgi:hypothetical protein
MPAQPLVQRLSPTVECVKPIIGQERSRWRQAFHTGCARASFPMAAILRAGAWTQASNFAQSLAGMTMLRRSRTSASAASIALRRMKSLKVVRDCAAADSSSVRSEALTRRLRMAGDADCGIGESLRIGCYDHLYYKSIHGSQRQWPARYREPAAVRRIIPAESPRLLRSSPPARNRGGCALRTPPACCPPQWSAVARSSPVPWVRGLPC